ncbi:hypothetical protein ABFA07_010847 [Porites harrisoni]
MLIPYALCWLLLVQCVDGQIWKLFERCYRTTEIPGSSVQKLEDRLNNNGCINFCRDKAFPLAATSNKQCVCLNSLPTTLLAISTDGDAASGPSSSCNIKCPGDAGESCFRTSCSGGPEQAHSTYATGGEWCVIDIDIDIITVAIAFALGSLEEQNIRLMIMS